MPIIAWVVLGCLCGAARSVQILASNTTGIGDVKIVEIDMQAATQRVSGSMANVCDRFHIPAHNGGRSVSLQNVHLGTYDVIVLVLSSAFHVDLIKNQHYPFHIKDIPESMLLLYVTDAQDPMLANDSTLLDGSPQKSNHNHVLRQLLSWRFVGAHCGGLQYKFIFQIDDDTVVSWSRLNEFLSALRQWIPHPDNTSKIIGRPADGLQDSPCSEVFGGNGMLATAAAVNNLYNLGDDVWFDAARGAAFGDGAISRLAKFSGMPDQVIVPLRGCFCTIEGKDQRQVNLLASPPHKRGAECEQLTFHSVRTPAHYSKVEAWMNYCGAKQQTYLDIFAAHKECASIA